MFNVGDKVIGVPCSPYSITGCGWIGVVTKIIGEHTMKVFDETSGEFIVAKKYFKLFKAEEKEENKMDVKEIITEEEKEMLLEDMKHLLDEYDYDYTEEALDRIIDTWAENKEIGRAHV